MKILNISVDFVFFAEPDFGGHKKSGNAALSHLPINRHGDDAEVRESFLPHQASLKTENKLLKDG